MVYALGHRCGRSRMVIHALSRPALWGLRGLGTRHHLRTGRRQTRQIVPHPLKAKPARRRRRPRSTSILRFEYLFRGLNGPSTTPDLDKRSHHVANLLVEKSLALDVHADFLINAIELDASNRSNIRLTLVARRGERREITPPHPMRRRLLHTLHIQRLPEVINESLGQMLARSRGDVMDSIPIQLRDRRTCRMKGQRHFRKVQQRHVLRQSRAETPRNRIRIRRTGRKTVGHIPRRMNSGVGSAATDQRDLVTKAPAQRLLQRALRRPQIGLVLPTVKIRPVKGEDQHEIPHHRGAMLEASRAEYKDAAPDAPCCPPGFARAVEPGSHAHGMAEQCWLTIREKYGAMRTPGSGPGGWGCRRRSV